MPASRAEFDKRYRRPSQPVVLRHDDPSLLARWTPEFLREHFGDLLVDTQMRDDLTGDRYGPIRLEYITRTLGDYIDAITSASETHALAEGYVAQVQTSDISPRFIENIEFPELYTRFHRTNFFLGPGGTRARLHYDDDENLFWQAYGRKHVVLAPPSSAPDLYVTNEWWGDGYSEVDLLDPDYERHPRLRDVPFYEVTIEPGDLLYIPLRWWHEVTSLDVSVTLSRIYWPIPLLLRSLVRRERTRLVGMLTGRSVTTNYGPPPDTERSGSPPGSLL